MITAYILLVLTHNFTQGVLTSLVATIIFELLRK